MSKHTFDEQIKTAMADRMAMLDRDAEHQRAMAQLDCYRNDIAKQLRGIDKVVIGLMVKYCVKRAVCGSSLLTHTGDILMIDNVHVIPES